MTLHSERRHRTALNKIKKLKAELSERNEWANDEIKKLTAQCDSLSVTAHVRDQELAELREEVVTLDAQLASAISSANYSATEREKLKQSAEDLKKAFISNVVRLEAALKDADAEQERRYRNYGKLERICEEWSRRATNAEARVVELEKTLSLLPGCDTPRSPQDVMDVVARLSRLEEMEVSSMYEAGRNHSAQERDALNGSVQAYSRRVAVLEEELKKAGKEYMELQEKHFKTVDELSRAQNYAKGPTWDAHREAIEAAIKTEQTAPKLHAKRILDQITRLRESMYVLTGKEFDTAMKELKELQLKMEVGS